MKKRKIHFILIPSLLIIIALLAYRGYSFYLKQVNQQEQQENVNTIKQISANQSEEEPYLQNPTYLSYVLSLDEEKAKKMDPTIKQVIFDALTAFNKDQMAYNYEMTNFEGVDSASISGKFDQSKGLFYEILQMGNTTFNYYLDGQYVQTASSEMDPYQENGKMADLIEPRGLFMDLLIRVQELKELEMSETDQSYTIKGQMPKDLSPFNDGTWTFKIDKTSHLLTSFQIEQDDTVIQSIKQVNYSDRADVTPNEIKELAKNYPNIN